MKKDLREEVVGEELILWDDPVLQADVLDRVQTRIYRLAEHGASLDQIEQGFREAFRVPPEQDVRPMLIDILHQFVRNGLIDELDPPLPLPMHPEGNEE